METALITWIVIAVIALTVLIKYTLRLCKDNEEHILDFIKTRHIVKRHIQNPRFLPDEVANRKDER